MSDFVLTGELKNGEQVKAMIRRFPNVYNRYLKAFMLREGTAFIGSKKKDGDFRKQLLSKIGLTGKTWKLNVVRLFKTQFDQPNKKLFDMTLRMGVLYNTRKQIHAAMEMLGEGGTIQSGKYMPIPMYANLKEIGINQPYKYFRRKLLKKEFEVVYKNGRAYYFDTKRKDASDKGVLLFMGIKKVTIRKQFDLYGQWDARSGRVLQNADKAIANATKKVEAGE